MRTPLVALALLLVSPAGGSDLVQDRFQDAVKQIERVQESRVGVHFPSCLPQLVWEKPPGYSPEYWSGCLASFNSSHLTIYLHTRLQQCAFLPFPERWGQIGMPPEPGMVSCNWDETSASLAHELGHFYTWSLARSEYPNSWLIQNFDSGSDPVGRVIQLVVIEGIGEYFLGAVFHEYQPIFSDDPDSLVANMERLHWGPDLVGQTGYWLVKPLIDRYGEAGLRYLLRVPLDLHSLDFSELCRYQEEALSALASGELE